MLEREQSRNAAKNRYQKWIKDDNFSKEQKGKVLFYNKTNWISYNTKIYFVFWVHWYYFHQRDCNMFYGLLQKKVIDGIDLEYLLKVLSTILFYLWFYLVCQKWPSIYNKSSATNLCNLQIAYRIKGIPFRKKRKVILSLKNKDL